MKNTQSQQVSEKSDKINRERERLLESFIDLDKDQKILIIGLIDEAAYLKIANEELRELLIITGTVKSHPDRPEIQKPIEAAKQYRQNVNSYAVVIKALSAVSGKNIAEGEDPLDEWKKQKELNRLKKQSS